MNGKEKIENGKWEPRGGVPCALIAERTLRDGLAVLSSLRPSIAGLRALALYKALCRDALHAGDGLRAGAVVCLLATSDERPAGIVLAVADPTAYWKRFMLRRPLLAARILAKRVAHRLAQRGSKTPAGAALRRHSAEPIPDSHSGTSAEANVTGGRHEAAATWSESNPRIAKILFVGVLPAFQRRGIGRELYESLCAVLRQNGVERVDARIGAENFPSIRLHREAGWQVRPDEQGMFATIDLRAPSPGAQPSQSNRAQPTGRQKAAPTMPC